MQDRIVDRKLVSLPPAAELGDALRLLCETLSQKESNEVYPIKQNFILLMHVYLMSTTCMTGLGWAEVAELAKHALNSILGDSGDMWDHFGDNEPLLVDTILRAAVWVRAYYGDATLLFDEDLPRRLRAAAERPLAASAPKYDPRLFESVESFQAECTPHTRARIVNAFPQYRYVGDLVHLTERDILCRAGFGRLALGDVRKALKKRGLHLGMVIPDWAKQVDAWKQAHTAKS